MKELVGVVEKHLVTRQNPSRNTGCFFTVAPLIWLSPTRLIKKFPLPPKKNIYKSTSLELSQIKGGGAM